MKHSLPYEKLSLPYIRDYVPDFHTDKYVLELKGVLDRDDARKIASAYSFLTTDKVYIIAGGKFRYFEELQQVTRDFKPTCFQYPDLGYVIAPQFSKNELTRYRLMRGKPREEENFPLKGLGIVAWANRLGIPSCPMSYTDHRYWEEYNASLL